jgi:tetratricopeptide (TPR) repeat protein
LDEFGEQGQYASLARSEIAKLTVVTPSSKNAAAASGSVLTPDALAQLALKELMNGDHDAALKLTSDALRTNKSLPLALAISGDVKLSIYGKRKEGRTELERAVQLEPHNILYLALLAKFNNEDYRKSTLNADWETAKRLANEALALTPKTEIDYYARGVSRSIVAKRTYGGFEVEEKVWAEAAAEFSTAIMMNPQFWIAYLERGKSYEAQLKYDEAIEDYAKLIELKPNDVTGYFYRGYVYGERREDYDKAIRDFDKAIEFKADEWFIIGLRGSAYLKKGDNDRAISDLTKAIQHFPTGRAYRDRAKAEEAIGRKDLAEADKKKADKMPY